MPFSTSISHPGKLVVSQGIFLTVSFRPMFIVQLWALSQDGDGDGALERPHKR